MPYQPLLTTLVQLLMRLIGAPAALDLVRQIPKLVTDPEGNVLDYDRDDPQTTARLLVVLYEAVLSELATCLAPPAVPNQAGGDQAGLEQVTSTLATSPVRILVVDDHTLVREALASLIEPQPGMRVVGQASSIREAIALAHSLRPDVVLMDFSLANSMGGEATQVIRALAPSAEIVFLAVEPADEHLFAALAAGARGYLLKSAGSAEMFNQLRGLARAAGHSRLPLTGATLRRPRPGRHYCALPGRQAYARRNRGCRSN